MSDTTYLQWPFFADSHRTLAHDVNAWAAAHVAQGEADDVKAAARALVAALGDGGWLRYAVPAPFGESPKLDVRSLCLIREALAYRSGLADFAFAMQGLGSGPISLFGSDAQQKKYLQGVAAGTTIAAFALSEDEAGSDIAALQTTATADGGDFIIDGEKTWISNAGIADFYVVFARSGEGPGVKGLSAFIVDAATSGCEVTANIDVISPHPLGTIRFEQCRVPAAQRLGDGGAGARVALATLDVFRATVGAAALGFARRALDEATGHVLERRVAEQALAEYQLTQTRVAAMATDVDASALLVYRSAWQKDSGAERVTRESSMAKWYATEAAQRVIDGAVQLFGARGVVSGAEVEMLYRDIRPLRIYEGTSEIQSLIVAREVFKQARERGEA